MVKKQFLGLCKFTSGFFLFLEYDTPLFRIILKIAIRNLALIFFFNLDNLQ